MDKASLFSSNQRGMLSFLHLLLTAACIVRCVITAAPNQCDPATNNQCLSLPYLTKRDNNKNYDGYIVEILNVTHFPKNDPPELFLQLQLISNNAPKELANLRLLKDSCRNRLVMNYFCQSYRLLVEDCDTLYDYVEQLTQKILLPQSVMIPLRDDVPCVDMDIYTISDELSNDHMEFNSVDMLVYSKAVQAHVSAAVNLMEDDTTARDGSTQVSSWEESPRNTPYPTIWMMWWQGWDHAPPIAQKCVESWHQHHPDWPLILLDKDNVETYFSIQEFLPHLNLTHTMGVHIVHYSGIIRFGLLYHHGGIWADATVICHKPLEQFIWSPSTGFFAFDNPLGRTMISTWFLASTSHSYIGQRMFEEAIQYWMKKDEADEYFWANTVFISLYQVMTGDTMQLI